MFQVMVVDDMEIIRREVKRLKLWGEKTGFVVSQEAGNGSEALDKLAKYPVDMVLTDIRMPKIDGIELLKTIMENKLCPCVVLISDYSEFSYARQGLVLGAFDYMLKPVNEGDMAKLLERVRDFLNEKLAEQQRIEQLEQTLEEKLEVFFPRLEVDQLVAAIKNADMKLIQYAGYVADIACSGIDSELVKAQSLLSSIMHAVGKEVLEEHKWLIKFISEPELATVDFSIYKDLDTAKAVFVKAVQRLADLLEKLLCGTREEGMVSRMCSYVLENIDSEVSLKKVSEQLFINKSYASEVFKSKTGIPFTEYLTTVRMERAKRLIADGRLRTYEVAEQLGYKDVEYFSKLFKKYQGVSPTEYRQNV